LGIVTGVVYFFVPFITAQGDRKNVLVEILISGTFLLSMLGYVEFFPLKHAQYLIPIALFVAYYAAIAIARGLEGMPFVGQVICIIVGVFVFIVVTSQVQRVKLGWKNTTQITQARGLLSLIPTQTPVVDLEGRMLFWPDAYYICCVPFGSFEQYLSRRPEKLRTVLEAKAVPYIFQGDTGRILMLSTEDQAYIYQKYTPVDGWKGSLWKRK
jgi:hypothetical protein